MDHKIVKPNLAMRGNLLWALIPGTVAFILAIAQSVRLLKDGDTFWHIAAGRWIVEHGTIPHVDPFSFTLPGIPWTAHEWLSEVLLYLAFQAVGWPGVIVLTATAFAAALAYLTHFLLRYLAPIHALMFSMLAMGMAAPHLLARPHLLAMPLLVFWVARLVRASEEGRTPGFWLLGIMVLWANLHGSFTLGIALTAAFGIEAVLNTQGRVERRIAARKWLTFLALASLAGILTPHGIEGILFTARVLDMSYALGNINEWASPNFHNFQFLELWLLLFLLLALTRGLRLPPVRLVILLVLIHMALKHGRNVELLGLLSPLILASPIAAQWFAHPDPAAQTGKPDRFFDQYARPAGSMAIVIMLVMFGADFLYKAQQGRIAPSEKHHPIAAIRAVEKAGITGPVYNQYNFGGYLIFSGIPVFIDGRADMYGDDFMERYLEAYRLRQTSNLEKLLDKYKVRWTVLGPNAPAVTLLDHLPGWRRLYADGTAIVHVRADAAGVSEP